MILKVIPEQSIAMLNKNIDTMNNVSIYMIELSKLIFQALEIILG